MRIPIDQFSERRDELKELTDAFNAATGRSDVSDDLVHYMKTQRKRGLWVKLEGARAPSPPHERFSAEQVEVLVDIYKAHVLVFGVASDILTYNEDVREGVAKEFAMRTGRRIPATRLAAKLEDMRKRGLLPKVEDVEQVADQDDGGAVADGFEDMDEVG